MYRLLFLLLLLSPASFAQEKYWITFKDKQVEGYNYEKNLSRETINNRIRFGLPLMQYSDVPVNQVYTDSLKQLGIEVLCRSKWLNSVSAFLSPEQVRKVSSMSFVREVEEIDRRIQMAGNLLQVVPEHYYLTQKQMQAEKFSELGITGKGVLVGVIDAGFYKAYEDKNLSHIFNEKKLIRQKDFLTPAFHDLVRDTVNDSDYHGRIVLSWICGYDSVSNFQMGMALNSRFLLARTENAAKEYRGEEDNWISAMEWMDSAGVRLINTSLGYSMNMDDPKDNYRQEDMNGSTARISQAAQIATDEKGIFLVVSAGNEGSNPGWRIISAPADAEGVLSVGATKEAWMRIDYSSIGPDFITYLKPNVSCFSQYGTSFSAPAVTGFVACLMERDSTLNNKELKKIVEKSGHLYPYGNNYLGYGIPQAGKALKLIEDREHQFKNFSSRNVKGKNCILKEGEAGMKEVIVFHKKNQTIVLHQETLPVKNGKVRIRKVPGAKQSTVTIGDELVEIIWE